MLDSARKVLPPELWGRVDEKCVYGPLGRSELVRIARLLVSESSAQLSAERNIRYEVTDAVLDYVLDKGGADPALGARPLRRAVQRFCENAIARAVLKGEAQADYLVIELDLQGQLSVYVPSRPSRTSTPRPTSSGRPRTTSRWPSTKPDARARRQRRGRRSTRTSPEPSTSKRPSSSTSAPSLARAMTCAPQLPFFSWRPTGGDSGSSRPDGVGNAEARDLLAIEFAEPTGQSARRVRGNSLLVLVAAQRRRHPRSGASRPSARGSRRGRSRYHEDDHGHRGDAAAAQAAAPSAAGSRAGARGLGGVGGFGDLARTCWLWPSLGLFGLEAAAR
ncbi:MAG: hypothetical protein U1F43_34790 [Myxococcota bacterium]